MSLLIIQSVVCGKEVDIKSEEKKSDSKQLENKRSVADAFSYVGGLEDTAYLISSDKFVGIQKTDKYMYKVAYSHTNTKSGDKITFTTGNIDETLTLFHFSDDFVSKLDEKCSINSKSNYNYTYITNITLIIVN